MTNLLATTLIATNMIGGLCVTGVFECISSDVVFAGADYNSEWMTLYPNPTYHNIDITAENVPTNLMIWVISSTATNVYIVKDGKLQLTTLNNKGQ